MGIHMWESSGSGIILFALPLLRGLRCLGLNKDGGGQISLITVSVSGDAGETIEMLHDLGGGAAEGQPGNEISPSPARPVGGECGPGGTPASPLQPSPGRAWPATDRGNWLRFRWVLFAKLFFSFSILASIPRLVLLLSPFTWLPTHAFMQQRATINVPGGAAFLSGFRVVPRAVRFVSHYYAVPDLLSWFCGHIIPATGWRSALFCQRLSSWPDDCDFMGHNLVQSQD